MAYMFQRGDTWYVEYFYRGKRKRRSLHTTSKMRAKAKVAEIEVAVNDGLDPDHRADYLIEDFTPRLEAHLRAGKAAHTVKTILHTWKSFRAWADPVQLSDITPDKIHAFKMHLLAEDYAKSTVRSNMLALSAIFRIAIKDLRCFGGANPVKGLDLPKADSRFPRFLDATEADTLLAAAKEHGRDMHLLTALGLYAGLRKNELINAQWSWIDFSDRGRVLVMAGGSFKPKSRRDRRIPLSARLRSVLVDYYTEGDTGYILYPKQADKGPGTRYRVDFTEAFGTMARRAGLPDVTPHTLRHTFASRLAQAGVSLFKVKEWLGHSDYATTQIYAHLMPDDPDIDKV